MTSLPDKADLVRALQDVIPNAHISQLDVLAQILAGERGLTSTHLSEDGIGEILRGLAGSTLNLSNSTVQFGTGNQFGDVTIRDIAGHDILHVNVAQTIITAEQAYHVRGLTNPYLGLRAFTYADRHRFAGRGNLITHAVNLLTALGEERALLFITGASGSGKSSLVQAGIIPALEGHAATRSMPFQYAVMRPSRQPLVALAEALRQLSLPASGPFAAAAPYTREAIPTPQRPGIHVLVIDQMEELFTQSEPDQRESLLHILGALPPFPEVRVHIIGTLRSDFLGELADYPAIEPAFREQLLVRVMDGTELKAAIQRPIQEAHPQKRIEPALLERLTTDAAGDAAYLPLLQVTLEDLWQRGSLTLSAYGTLTDAIRERAEAVYHYQDYDGARQRARSVDEQETIMALLLDLIEIGPDDDSRRDVRQRRDLAKLTQGKPARMRLIDDLATARLVSKGVEQRAGAEVEVVDIIHESLIANWQRFQSVIAGRREALQRRSRFEAALRLWVARGKPDDELLSGGRLAEAQVLDEAHDVAFTTPNARELLGRSVAHQDTMRRQQLRRTQIFAGILGVLLMVAIATGGWAFNRSNEATAQLHRSEAHRLAFAVQTQLDNNPEVGLLLAYEANVRDDNAVTSQVLRDEIDAVTWYPTSLSGHMSWVTSAVFSPDGQHILTASDDGTARLWDASGQPLATLKGHMSWVTSAVFSPDGQRILTASIDGTARLWDASGQPLAILTGHMFYVPSAVFSPDSQRILTASRDDGTARLWDASGQPLATLKRHTNRVNSAMFSPDNQRILTASNDKTARLWDASGQPLATLTGHMGFVTSAVFSPDGQRILTSGDNTARLWDASGQPLATLEGHTNRVNSAVFSPDGQRILTASWDNTARLWDASGQPFVTLTGHTEWVNSAVFSPDDQRILTASSDGTARLWDASGQPLAILKGHPGAVLSAVFSPDGQRILTASSDGTARLWDASGQPFVTLNVHTSWPVNSAVFSPDGQRILTASNDGTARLWDTSVQSFNVHTGEVISAVFSPDGQRILIASSDGTARLWDASGQPLAILKGHTSAVTSAEFSPDGQRILTASNDKTARLWDASGQPLATLNTDGVRSAEFSPDGQRILTTSNDKTARLWDASGQPLAILKGHTSAVTSAVFSPDGQRILTASSDGARLWDTSGQPLATLTGDTGEVWRVVFSPDGQRILTASPHSRMVRLWDASGQPLATLEEAGDLTSVVFSPDGQRILTASSNGTVAWLWDASGRPLAFLLGHTGWVTSAVFSPDGQRILTASWDGTARLWDATGQPLAILQGHIARVNSAVFSPDGTRILTASADGTARQYLVRSEDLRRTAACRVGRGLTQEEISRFQVPIPLAFDFATRQCPPVYSWQQASK